MCSRAELGRISFVCLENEGFRGTFFMIARERLRVCGKNEKLIF